jgi:hypothetical protein
MLHQAPRYRDQTSQAESYSILCLTNAFSRI